MDALTVARGAAAGVLLGVPVALANVALSGRDPAPRALLNLTLLGLLVAFGLAGLVAARLARADRARHAAAAGVVAFVPVQLLGVLGRIDRDAPVSAGQIVFLGLLAAVAGTLGGLLGARGPRGAPDREVNP